MSEHTLELGMLKHPIRSPPRDQVNSCLNKLGNHHRIAVVSIETNQSRLCCESEVRQVGFDGTKRRSQFTLIVAIPSIPIRADPLTGRYLCALWYVCGRPHPAYAPCSPAHRRHRGGVVQQEASDRKVMHVVVLPGV
jgi:hypothetical protein